MPLYLALFLYVQMISQLTGNCPLNRLSIGFSPDLKNDIANDQMHSKYLILFWIFCKRDIFTQKPTLLGHVRCHPLFKLACKVVVFIMASLCMRNLNLFLSVPLPAGTPCNSLPSPAGSFPFPVRYGLFYYMYSITIPFMYIPCLQFQKV